MFQCSTRWPLLPPPAIPSELPCTIFSCALQGAVPAVPGLSLPHCAGAAQVYAVRGGRAPAAERVRVHPPGPAAACGQVGTADADATQAVRAGACMGVGAFWWASLYARTHGACALHACGHVRAAASVIMLIVYVYMCTSMCMHACPHASLRACLLECCMPTGT